MRRFIGVGAGIVLLLATLAAPAAAYGLSHGSAGPILGRGGISFDMKFDANQLCSFPVHWVEDGSRMYSLTFPVQRNGDKLVIYAGPQWSTVTNGDTGASMVAGGNLVMDWISHEDGTADVWVVGTVVAGYLPTDAPGMGLWVLNGQLHDKVGADGWSTIAHSFRGRAVDLCKALT